MSTKRQGTLLLALLGSLLLAGAVLAAPTATTVDRYVLGGGGGHAEAAPYTLDGTIGQPLVGCVGIAGTELCAGFWSGGVSYTIYLPLVLRNR